VLIKTSVAIIGRKTDGLRSPLIDPKAE